MSVDAFTPLPYWTGSAYQVSDQFPDPTPELRHLKLTATTGHTGRNENFCVIRRWTAPIDAKIRIDGTIKHTRPNGDGVIAAIRHKDLVKTFDVFNSESKTQTDLISVKKGDVVDFVVSPKNSPTADAHSWIVTISSVSGKSKDEQWNSQEDFGAPPPPPLDPMAQLAQALLLTNEFLYVD